MSVHVEHVNFKYLDIADRRHPERSGRYVPLSVVLAIAQSLRLEPKGMDQLITQLSAVARQ